MAPLMEQPSKWASSFSVRRVWIFVFASITVYFNHCFKVKKPIWIKSPALWSIFAPKWFLIIRRLTLYLHGRMLGAPTTMATCGHCFGFCYIPAMTMISYESKDWIPLYKEEVTLMENRAITGLDITLLKVLHLPLITFRHNYCGGSIMHVTCL